VLETSIGGLNGFSCAAIKPSRDDRRDREQADCCQHGARLLQMNEAERDPREDAEQQHARPFQFVAAVDGQRQAVRTRGGHSHGRAEQAGLHRRPGGAGDGGLGDGVKMAPSASAAAAGALELALITFHTCLSAGPTSCVPRRGSPLHRLPPHGRARAAP